MLVSGFIKTNFFILLTGNSQEEGNEDPQSIRNKL